MTTESETQTEGVKEIWYRVCLVFNELFSHTLVLALVIVSIAALHRLMMWLHDGHETIFFDGTIFKFNAVWLFDAADASMITALLYRGVVSAYRAYRGTKR
jgi:hypothetical protein